MRKPSFLHFQYPYPPGELGAEVIAAAATLGGEALELTDADDVDDEGAPVAAVKRMIDCEVLELTDGDDAVDDGAPVVAVKRMIDCEVLEATEEVEEDKEVVLAEDDTGDVEELEAEEVEGLPPPRRLDRTLVASPGVRVVVKVASVMVAEGRIVTVTVDFPAVPEGSWDPVDVPFVSVPKMPPVAPVAAMTDAALASLVQVNNYSSNGRQWLFNFFSVTKLTTPSALTDGMAKQFCVFAQRPLDVSQVPLAQVAREFSTQATSPAILTLSKFFSRHYSSLTVARICGCQVLEYAVEFLGFLAVLQKSRSVQCGGCRANECCSQTGQNGGRERY